MIQIFCDFDGTITNRDSIVFLTERFGAGPEYRQQVLEKITSGEITVFEAIRREMETVTVPWAEAERVLKAEIRVDATFPAFVNWCGRKGHPLAVVSSGLEPVVSLFVREFEIPYYAHPVHINERGWRYQRRPEFDKERILEEARARGRIVFIGDGTSDVAAIPFADVLFAKDYLADYCRRHNLPYTPFHSFDDVVRHLQE